MKSNSLELIGGSISTVHLQDPSTIQSPTLDMLAADDDAIYRWTGTAWDVLAYLKIQPLYPFTSHTFNNAGQVGAVGPTLAQLRTAYSSAAWAANSAFLESAAGIQKWTVPETAQYDIVLTGAISLSNDPRDPSRTRVSGRVALTKGDVLSILCGQIGSPPFQAGGGTYTSCSVSSSPGGTFVESTERGLIAVAGGAGLNVSGGQTSLVSVNRTAGDYRVNSVVHASASAETNGGQSMTVMSGTTALFAFGGGGYNGDGVGAGGGKSFKNGGAGGTWTGILNGSAAPVSTAGGFGGGGTGTGITPSSQANAASVIGGAGGYTGGTGGTGQHNIGTGTAGTGGSYIASFAVNPFTGIVNEAMTVRNGSVVITKVAA